MRKISQQRGQVGLLLLVILGLLITLVLSLASRSLSDTSLARQEKEQSATFGVAESGVEEALSSIRLGTIPAGTTSLTDTAAVVSGTYDVTAQNGLDIYIREGEVAQVDMTGYSFPNLTVLWTKRVDANENVSCVSEGSGLAPAGLEVIMVQGSTEYTRSYYNPFGCALASNGFVAPSDGGGTYLSRIDLVTPVGLTAIRLRPIYNGATIFVSGISLPSQLYVIRSQATGGDAKKEIEAKRTIDYPASVFDFSLFSGSTIVK